MTIKSFIIVLIAIITVAVNAEDERTYRISFRITNGAIASPNEFPYIVGIEVADINTCGGSILKPNIVLTAAHCVSKYLPLLLKVRAGTAIREDYRGQNVQMRLVKQIITHPQYNISAYNDNDISILILKTPFSLNNFVNAVQLPNMEYNGEDAVIIGWGKDENFNEVTNLKSGNVQIVPSENCILKNYKITSNMICSLSKSRKETICKGDSGGPMVIHQSRNPKEDILVGITSFGGIVNKAFKRYCDANSPAVYTNIFVQRKWILKEIERYI